MTQMTTTTVCFFRYFEASHSRSIRRQRGLTQWKEMFNVLHVLINLKLWVNVNLKMLQSGILPNFWWVFVWWRNLMIGAIAPASLLRYGPTPTRNALPIHWKKQIKIHESSSASMNAPTSDGMVFKNRLTGSIYDEKVWKISPNLELLTKFSRFGWLFWRGSRMLTFHFQQNLRGLGDNWTQRFGLHPHQGMVSGCFRYLKPYLNKPFEFHVFWCIFCQVAARWRLIF